MFKLENFKNFKFMWENVDIFAEKTKDNNVLELGRPPVKTRLISESPRACGRLGCSHMVVSAIGGTVVTLQPASSGIRIIKVKWAKEFKIILKLRERIIRECSRSLPGLGLSCQNSEDCSKPIWLSLMNKILFWRFYFWVGILNLCVEFWQNSKLFNDNWSHKPAGSCVPTAQLTFPSQNSSDLTREREE